MPSRLWRFSCAISDLTKDMTISHSLPLLVAAAVLASACTNTNPPAHSVAEGQLVWLTGAAQLKNRLNDIALTTPPRTLGDSCQAADVFFETAVNGSGFDSVSEAVQLVPNRARLVADSQTLISNLLSVTPPLERLARDYQERVRKFDATSLVSNSATTKSADDALRATFTSNDDTMVVVFGKRRSSGDMVILTDWIHKYTPSAGIVFISPNDQSELNVKLCEAVTPQLAKLKPQSGVVRLTIPRVVVLDIDYFDAPRRHEPVPPPTEQATTSSESKPLKTKPPPSEAKWRDGEEPITQPKKNCKAAITRLKDSLASNLHPELDARNIAMRTDCTNMELARLQNLCESNFRDKVRDWSPDFTCEYSRK